MYEKQIRPCPTAADIPNILAQFHTRPVDEKFEDEDIIRPSSNQSAISASASPAASVSPGVSPSSGSAPPPPAPRPPPPRAPPAPTPKYVVAFDYNNSVEEGMMSISVGEELNITDQSDPDWWNATKLSGPEAGQSGWVPAAYVKKV